MFKLIIHTKHEILKYDFRNTENAFIIQTLKTERHMNKIITRNMRKSIPLLVKRNLTCNDCFLIILEK